MKFHLSSSYTITILLAILVAYIYFSKFEITPLRQIFGLFIFLFVPGWAFLSFCQLGNMGLFEKIPIYVGLSTAYLMFLGIFINRFLYSIGEKYPLSFYPMFIAFLMTFILIAIISWWGNHNRVNSPYRIINAGLIFREPLLLLSFFFPVLAVLGAEFMNSEHDNRLLLSIYIIIPIYVIILILIKSRATYVYAGSIWAIGLAFILMYSLRSNHMLGYDVHFEYFLSQRVFQNSYWDLALSNNPSNACSSVVILPPMLQGLLNINGEYIYKIIYAFLFSLIILSIFYSSRRYLSDKYAFLASFFYISQMSIILASQSNPRTSLALLFFSLFIVVLANENISYKLKRLLLIIFSLGLILSHYTSAVIFFFIVAFGYLAGNIERTYKQTSRIEIQKSFLVLILVVIFLWYVQICETRFDQGAVYATKNVVENFGKFFVEEARPEGTLQVMGIGIRSLGDSIYSFSHYLISLLIALGTCFVLYENVRGTGKRWVSDELTSAHLGMVAGAAIVLTSMVLLPQFSNVYTLDRMWSQAMILLSLSFIFGGIMVAGRKESKKALIIILITTLFLYANNSYLIYQFLGEQRSLVLNSDGPDFAHFYVHDPEIAAALWLANMTKNESLVYSDPSGGVRLSYGNLRDRWNTVTFFRLNKPLDKGNYLYLGYVNVILNIIYMGNNHVPLQDYSHLFAKSKKTYDNGNANVFFN